jgi:hypothetical protein
MLKKMFGEELWRKNGVGEGLLHACMTSIWIQLFQLRSSPSKAEKSNTSAKGLLGIAKKLMNLLAIPSKHFALVFDFSAYTLKG